MLDRDIGFVRAGQAVTLKLEAFPFTRYGALTGRIQRMKRIEVDTQRLVQERARLATELDKTSARAKRLDDSAHDVSRRLVEAMETVRSVLAKTE